MDRSSRVIAIVGPTAVGKTDVAVALALAHNAEIISADSMAVYRGADIGTAKPTPDQRRLVPFHLLDVVEPRDEFDVAEYRALALEALDDIHRRHRRALVVGGTGLYIRAVLDGLGLTAVPADHALRQKLWDIATREGSHRLHARLADADPPTAARLHPNDTVRIVRALEVWHKTGVPLSEWLTRDRQQRRPLNALRIGLTIRMEVLDRRIDARVDAMMAQGLLDEVQRLLDRGACPGKGIMRGLGYRELCEHLLGTSSLSDAVEAIKRNTRRFARRQRTWFRGDPSVRWIDVTDATPDDIAEQISAAIQAEKRGTRDNG